MSRYIRTRSLLCTSLKWRASASRPYRKSRYPPTAAPVTLLSTAVTQLPACHASAAFRTSKPRLETDPSLDLPSARGCAVAWLLQHATVNVVARLSVYIRRYKLRNVQSKITKNKGEPSGVLESGMLVKVLVRSWGVFVVRESSPGGLLKR